jgi:LysM repeat protein
MKERAMTRKDTILIAVVVNAGLLAILFTTAMIYDHEKSAEQTEFVTPIAGNKSPPSAPPPNLIAANSTGDEVDNVLRYYTRPASSPAAVDTQAELYTPEPIAVQSNAADDEELVSDPLLGDQDQFVLVTVKKGDMLEKIARANKTSVGAIKRANQLPNEKLSIGQVLKVPVKKESASPFPIATPPTLPKVTESSDAVYYVVKSGDSPWKIAKQFNVSSEDILRLNHLDEEKARNLKVGERIRVK